VWHTSVVWTPLRRSAREATLQSAACTSL
jgi:hypothetical protein